MLFEGEYGSVVAMIEAGAVTAIRTAAVSAVATQALARADAGCLALIGSGVQAASHLAAMAAVRPLREVRVWSPDRERCAAFVKRATDEFGVNAETGAADRDQRRRACLVTPSPKPTSSAPSPARPRPSSNRAGSAPAPTSTPSAPIVLDERELDSATIQRARVFVDYLPSAMEEAGDILIPIGEHIIDRTHVLGDLTSLVTESRARTRRRRTTSPSSNRSASRSKTSPRPRTPTAARWPPAQARASRCFRGVAINRPQWPDEREDAMSLFDLTRRDFVQRLAALGGAARAFSALSVTSVAAIAASAGAAPAPLAANAARPLTLWYRRPASRWVEALPIGNGRLGAMIFGGIGSERLQLNEDTLWSGGPKDWDNPKAKEILPELRRLIAAGRYVDADTLAKQALGPYTQSYLPLGDLHITFAHGDVGRRYRRELDLRTGIATQQYAIGGVTYTREAIASHPDGVIAMRLAADRPGLLAFSARLTSPLRHMHRLRSRRPRSCCTDRAPSHVDPNYYDRDEPVMLRRCPRTGMRFAAHLGAMLNGGGQVRVDRDGLHVEGATEAILVIGAATSFNGFAAPASDPARHPAALASSRAERRAREVDGSRSVTRTSPIIARCWSASSCSSTPPRHHLHTAPAAATAAPTAACNCHNVRQADRRMDRDRWRERRAADRAAVSIRPLSADREQPSWHAAGESAGHLERARARAVELELDAEYQRADELLARRKHQSRGAARPAARLHR